jgi:branched-chain amino acid transport system ATP-binding protein
MVLEVDHIAVFYGDVQVLFDVSLHVGAEEIVTLIGSNGAGKSTTVNTISGLLRPRHGTIRFNGTPITMLAPHRLVSEGIVQVPEGRLLYPQLTVRDHLKLGAYPAASRKAMRQRMEWVFELFPRLQERVGQVVSKMSGGEQQMVAIARGLMSQPRLLILDEPSIGLAPRLVKGLFEVIQEINRHRVAVLLIEQNATQALSCAHRGYVLEHGHIVQSGPAALLLEDASIRSAYLGL